MHRFVSHLGGLSRRVQRHRTVTWFVIGFASIGSVLLAGTGLLKPGPSYYSSSTPLIGRTSLSAGAGCTGCHGTGLTVSIPTGPGVLYPGQAGTYAISGTGGTNGTRFGINVKATGGTLSVTSPSLIVDTGEIRHRASPTALTTVSGGTASYSFTYTMSGGSTVGTAYTIAGVAATGVPGTNANSGSEATKSVTAIRPSDPSGATLGTVTSSSVGLSWTGSGPEYRVVYKTGSFPASATDGSISDVATTPTTISGLSASTTYYFAVYGRATYSATNTFSTGSTTATTTTGAALDPNPWVDAAAGSNSNAGSFDAPFKTIKKALTAVGPTGTIHVRPGTYNTALGETFPMTIPSGAKLQSTAGAAATIIDATGANTHVIYCSANSSSTLIEGFTITGGLYTQAADGNSATGGGILMENSDQTAVKRCIIAGNEVRGYNGNGSFFSGGSAYGGGIGITNGTHAITNCVIRNNIARGGNGFAPATIGYAGGDGHGGGISDSAGTATLMNCTVYGNQAIGGNGANAISGTSNGGTGGTALYAAADIANGTVTNTIVANNAAIGGTGGNGFGGGSNGANGAVVSGGLNATAASYNAFFSNTGGDGFTGTNANTGQDPLFVNPPGDLHVRSASPAKYAGTSSGAPTVDLENNPRPAQPSIGAYELGLFLKVTGGIGRITISWNGVDGASSYNLYMSCLSCGAGGVTLGSPKVTGATSPYVLYPLANNTSYDFAITAIENGIEGTLGPSASGTTSGGAGGPWVSSPTTGTNFTNITRDLADGNTLYATATDSVGLYKSTDAGNTWVGLTGPFSGFGMHAVAANGSNVLAAGQGAIYRSTNGGGNWTTSVSGGGIGEDFINSMAIDPLAPTNVYAGDFHIDGGSTATDLIAKSVNSGASFNNITDASAANLRAYYLQIDPAISGTLYAAGSGTPNVAKSVNNGGTWTSVSPVGGYPTALALAPSSTITLYAGMKDVDNTTPLGVYKTTSGGTSWSPANGWPVSAPNIYALLVDPANANHVHAGTSSGYYVTTNGGTNWTSGASGAGSFFMNAMTQTTNRRLVATTSNSLIIMLPLDAAPSVNANANPSTGSTAGGDVVTVTGTGFNPSPGLRVLFGGVDGVVNLAASTPTLITVTTPAHAAGSVDVAVINPDGQASIRTNGYTYVVCNYSISPTSASYSSAGATGFVQVTVNTGCQWTATAPGGSFVSITSGSPGNGNGTVQYSVASNGTGSGRSTTLTIAGISFPVDQSAFGGGSFAMTATASNGSVSLSWASVGAPSYDVMRSSGGGGFGTVTTTSSLAFADTTVANGTGYLYRVHASTGSDSNVDLAVPFAYTDSSLAAGTSIKAAHFAELRSALNAGRAALGWPAMTFTDPSLAGVAVKRIHLIELRSGVDGVRVGVGLSALSYTDPAITAGTTPVRASHVLELRSGLQ